MQYIKELLLEQIKEYDQRAAKCCVQIVEAHLNNKPEPNNSRTRMITCIASREALRHFGEVCGLLEKADCKREM